MASSDKKGRLGREIIAIIFLFLAVFIGCCLVSYNTSDPSLNTAYSSGVREVNNWGGIIGSYVADASFQFIGLSAFIIPLILVWISLKFFLPLEIKVRYFLLLSYLFFIISLSGMFGLVWVEPKIRVASFSYELNGGGVVGSQLAKLSLKYLNRLGSYTLFSLVGIVSFILITDFSLLRLIKRCRRFLSLLVKGIVFLVSMLLRWSGRVKVLGRTFLSMITRAKGMYARWKMERVLKHKERQFPSESQPLSTVGKADGRATKRMRSHKQESQEGMGSPFPYTEYKIPPLSLLDSPSQKVTKANKEVLKENSKVLESKLEDFGIQGRVVEVNPGPVITRYEFEPGSGVRISKILGLADDLALALKAIGVRILAPVPGKAVVGIEIPNAVREIVCFKEIVGREKFLNAQSKLTLALGKGR